MNEWEEIQVEELGADHITYSSKIFLNWKLLENYFDGLAFLQVPVLLPLISCHFIALLCIFLPYVLVREVCLLYLKSSF